MKWIYATRDDRTAKRIDSVVVYENGETLARYSSGDIYVNMRKTGKRAAVIYGPAKWNTQHEADLNADYMQLVKVTSVWNDTAYDMYIPNAYIHAYLEKRARSGYYMYTYYACELFGRTMKVDHIPGYKPYALQSTFEEAAKYHYTDLDIATPAGREWAASIVSAINDAIEEAARIRGMSDAEFFDVFKEA